MQYSATIHESWSTVDVDTWDALVPDRNPFMSSAWLGALERAGCTDERTQWLPRPVLVSDGTANRLALPAYLVSHDDGQFIYQGHWEDAAQKANLSIHPKIFVGSPFTPVQGPRILTSASDPSDTLAAAFHALHQHAPAAQAWLVSFPDPSELPAWQSQGLFQRMQYQYCWQNQDYASFGDFLSDFRSKRRKEILRERRTLDGISVEVIERPTPELFSLIADAYFATIERHDSTQAFLNRPFFEEIGASLRRQWVAVVASRGGRVIAGALCLRHENTLYGRFWGQLEPVENLHFEVCYHRAIEYCIAQGIRRYEPGHGGEHKYLRGFDPVPTYSAHAFAHPGVHRAFSHAAKRETDWFLNRIEELRRGSPLKSTRADAN